MKNVFLFIFLSFVASSCAVSNKFSLNKKYSKQQLQSDYTTFRDILEKTHPSLYWYTPKDSMDYYFSLGESMLNDSLTESGFRKVLSYVTSKMHCGHTQVKPSKPYERAARKRSRFFPLSLKLWQDTAVVVLNLSKKDSTITRGTVIKSIDHQPVSQIVDSLFQFLSADGYNATYKYQALSNRGTFGNLYTWIFGWKQKYIVDYLDTSGNLQTSPVSIYIITRDSSEKKKEPKERKPSLRERKLLRLQGSRSIRFDTAVSMAIMDLGTFTRGYDLRGFFKSSFKKLRKNRTQNLVIDLRGNGGGSVGNSTLLTRYISDHRFKIADSLYSLKRHQFSPYMQNRFFIWAFLQMVTHRDANGRFHFRLFERRYFRPKTRNHYDGTVYVLTGGNTFSASTLFLQSVKDQKNVVEVGEETGGGAYGNTAWIIPDVTLPITKVRFRLPLFRLVIDKNLPKNGHGIIPEVEAKPTVKDIQLGIDYKMEKVVEIIKSGL